MATMRYAGLRCSEALVLRPRDVDLERYLLKIVRGKGGKEGHPRPRLRAEKRSSRRFSCSKHFAPIVTR